MNTAAAPLWPDDGTPSPISLDLFRAGMRRLTGAVNLVTTVHEGRPHGLTATAVCSLSGQPPRLLACVNVGGRCFDYLLKSRRLGVNVLALHHLDLARRFANMTGEPEENRFADGNWRTAEGGAPLLADALTAFDCVVDEIFITPSHGVVIGEIKSISFGPAGDPLLYSDGAFTSLRPVS